MEPIVQVKNLSVQFDTEAGPLKAVDQVSFSVNPGEVVGIVGESGCGKSVTSMSILRLIPRPPGRFVGGEVIYKGKDLLTLPLNELQKIRGNGISMIFQEPMTALSPLMRVGHQLVEALRLHNPDMDKKEAWRIAEEWLAKVGIPDTAERMFNYPYQMSGGMRQRVMIAMSLILEPELIIADEPTTALDVTIQAQVFELMKDLIKDSNTALLLITHDMGVIWELCDRVIVMYASHIVEQGPKEEIFAAPAHPYTKGLLQAMPKLDEDQDELYTIEGSVPSPLNYPPGCNFCDRCPLKLEKCATEEPDLMSCGTNHQVACWHPEAGVRKEDCK